MKTGFTLLELVFLIALLGILVGLWIESAGRFGNVAIDGASRKVRADIQYAQQLAQTSGVPHGVKFAAGVSYELYRGTPGHPVQDPTTRNPMVETLGQFRVVSIATNYEVRFGTTGSPTIGGYGRVRLTSTDGAVREIYVVGKTGAVLIDEIELGGCGCEICE